jgi:hypothetical protein
MRMELELEQGRPVHNMDDQELGRALIAAQSLLNLHPTPAVRVALGQFLAEVQRERHKRPKAEGDQPREVDGFTNAELEAAIQHATDPRDIRPRHGVQLVMTNFQLSLMLEQRRRVKALVAT